MEITDDFFFFFQQVMVKKRMNFGLKFIAVA